MIEKLFSSAYFSTGSSSMTTATTTTSSHTPAKRFVVFGLAGIIGLFCITWLKIRPLGLAALLVLGFWLYETKSSVKIVPPPELKTKLTMATQRIQEIRKEKPTLFCAVSTVTLVILAIFGHMVSGSAVVVVGLIIAAIVSTKYNFKIVKIERKDFQWSKEQDNFPNEDDEFLPEVNESNIFVLERASDLASLSSQAEENDDKSDEIPSELLIPDSIPEIDESDSTDEEDILLKTSPQLDTKPINQFVDKIEFKRGHFKKDSSISTSSSSDEELSKGLKFPDYTTVDGNNQLQSNQQTSKLNMGMAASSILPNLVSGVVQWAATAGAERMTKSTIVPKTYEIDSSENESDFEILENDDFK